MYSIHIYFLVGAGIYIIYFINRHTQKMWRTLLLVILTLIIIISPRLIHEGYEWWKDYKHYHQDFTSESFKGKFYNESLRSIRPMKNINIISTNQHIYIKMEYDPTQNYNQTDFEKRMLSFIYQEIYLFSNYDKLHRVTYEIKYYDDMYVFEDIPLKNIKNDTYYGVNKDSDSLYSLIESKMKIITGD